MGIKLDVTTRQNTVLSIFWVREGLNDFIIAMEAKRLARSVGQVYKSHSYINIQ